MKSSRWKLGTLAAAAVAASTMLSPAQAAPVISVSFSTANVKLGDPLGIDINLSGLTEAIGGFAFDLTFDGVRLSFVDYAADPDTKMGDGGANAALNFSGGNTGSSVNFDVLAGYFMPADEPTLAALQGTGFRLGRVGLTAQNTGFAAVTLSGFSLSDYDGATITGVTARNTRVCVSVDGVTPCAINVVPEPASTTLLLAAALGALAFTRRQKAA